MYFLSVFFFTSSKAFQDARVPLSKRLPQTRYYSDFFFRVFFRVQSQDWSYRLSFEIFSPIALKQAPVAFQNK